MGVIYLIQGNPSAAPMDASHLLPPWTGIASLVLIVNNFLSYSGMEMNAVHVSELKEPGKEFPRSMFLAIGLVLLIFILPALAVSWIVPADGVSLTAGIMQAFSEFFGHFGLVVPRPPRGARARVRGDRRDARLARRAVQGAAADRQAEGLPAAVLPEGSTSRASRSTSSSRRAR